MQVDARWTIEELCRHAGALVNEGALALRTVRYYAALGLLDRPSALHGRKAFYGERHLLQLAAVRRLQQQGLTLEAVQSRIAGASTTTLRALAQVAEKHRLPAASKEVPARDDEGFWSFVAPDKPVAADAQPVRLATVPLADVVTLTLAARAALSGADVDAIHAAARPLLDELRRRGLLSSVPE